MTNQILAAQHEYIQRNLGKRAPQGIYMLGGNKVSWQDFYFYIETVLPKVRLDNRLITDWGWEWHYNYAAFYSNEVLPCCQPCCQQDKVDTNLKTFDVFKHCLSVHHIATMYCAPEDEV